MSVYEDDDLVRNLTESVVSRGLKVFQIFKTGADAEHVAELLRIFDLPENAAVLDAGCGVGEVARLMKDKRPDVDFTLLNISAAQLAMCPSGFKRIRASFESLPLPCRSYDGVMFNYSLGHGDIDKAFSEAARVLKPGGVLFIYDMEGDKEVIGYQVRPAEVVIAAAEANGLIETVVQEVDADAEAFKPILAGEDFDAMFTGIRPIVYRFVKC